MLNGDEEYVRLVVKKRWGKKHGPSQSGCGYYDLGGRGMKLVTFNIRCDFGQDGESIASAAAGI